MEENAKKKIFYKLYALLEESSDYIKKYNEIPRVYEGILLYQVETHTIQKIGRKNNITTSELAKIMHKTNSAVSQIIQKLKKNGLVKTERNAKNNREIFITLSELGQKVFARHELLDDCLMDELYKQIEDFSEEDFKHYMQIQEILNQQFKKDVEQVTGLYKDFMQENKKN